jgi:hypothetical protein
MIIAQDTRAHLGIRVLVTSAGLLLWLVAAGPADAGGAPCPDVDMDGYADCTVPGCDDTGLMCGDCDDGDANVNPAEVEACNHVDDDCNGLTDEGFSQPISSVEFQDVASGAPSDNHGVSIANLGDVTGDGVDDIAVGI